MQFNFLQPRHWVAIGLGVGAAIVLSSLLIDGEVSARFKKQKEPPVLVTTGTVKPDQILASVFSEHKIEYLYAAKIQKTLSEQLNLRRDIHPGHQYKIVTSTSGLFKKFVYVIDPIKSFTVTRSSTGVYSLARGEKKTVWLEKRVTCVVSENIYLDLKKMGYKERFVANLVADLADNIFAWRIDFFTEQRPGDQVEILMEQEYELGSDKPIPGGKHHHILVAYYRGQATKEKDNYAIRYTAPGQKHHDYFDRDGKAVRKAFLRAPFTHRGFRISSHFNLRRYHPIRRTYRPHHGIDYAASRGTRVAAVGKGKVIHTGWKGNYGNTIEVRHSNKYTSRYGHLSRINVKNGAWVEQGQSIGRVGSTGLSTGPHLHFEMLVDGRQRNFLRMNFPSAKSISAKNTEGFQRVRDQLLGRLRRRQAQARLQNRSSSEFN